MGVGFEEWVRGLEMFALEPHASGTMPLGGWDLLREIFDAEGPVGAAQVERRWDAREDELARGAVALFVADLRRTTALRPTISVRRDRDGFLIVDYDGNFSAPPFSSMRNPEVVAEVADNLRDHVVDDVWGPWPLCPADGGAVDPQVRDGQAVWNCPRGKHTAGLIGELVP